MIDYRKLNSVTTKDRLPIPNIDDIFDNDIWHQNALLIAKFTSNVPEANERNTKRICRKHLHCIHG